MKAKELMLGDFITLADSLENDKEPLIFKVVGLGYDGEETALVLLNGEKACDIVEIDKDWSGIPITPEILEENGFDINGIPEDMQPVEERDWSDDTYVWSRQETPYESTEVCVYMEDPDNFFAEIICPHCHVDGVHIKYVHELQHALRLCGIDKEIEL